WKVDWPTTAHRPEQFVAPVAESDAHRPGWTRTRRDLDWPRHRVVELRPDTPIAPRLVWRYLPARGRHRQDNARPAVPRSSRAATERFRRGCRLAGHGARVGAVEDGVGSEHRSDRPVAE